MPDVTVFIRPDVTIGAAVPATVSHPRLHDFTNAVRVQQGASDLGVVEIRVGQGLNANVTLGTETTIAGAGHAVTVRAGDAVGAGPSAGGDITIQPGVGIGGGTNGLFVPYATAVVNLGSDARVWGTTFTRGMRPDTGQNLDVRTIQTGAGAGPNITLLTADAGGAGPANGGDLILRTGVGAGAGTRGVIRFDDGGAAMSVLPTTTNLVTLGSASLALAAVRTRAMQADAGQSLTLNEAGGNARMTFVSSGSIQVNSGGLQPLDNINVQWGNGSDVQSRWGTVNANNAMVFAIGVNSAAQSGNVILTTAANIANEHGLAAVATPRLAIFSAADMSAAENRTQHAQIYHDGTNGILATGTGRLTLASNNNVVYIGSGGAGTVNATEWANVGGTAAIRLETSIIRLRANSASTDRVVLDATAAGATFATFTQPVNTSGTPTGLLWTGALHQTLASAEFHDWNLNFANGGAAQITQNAVAIALMRTFRIQPRTYSATAATQVITDAATVAIDGPPGAGANVTITTAWAIRVATGSIGYGDGTDARPGLGPTSDPNTGLFAQAADAIGFSTGGTERMRLDTEAGADNTALWISRVGVLQRVTLDAPDSGGVGFRALRVPN